MRDVKTEKKLFNYLEHGRLVMSPVSEKENKG